MRLDKIIEYREILKFRFLQDLRVKFCKKHWLTYNRYSLKNDLFLRRGKNR